MKCVGGWCILWDFFGWLTGVITGVMRGWMIGEEWGIEDGWEVVGEEERVEEWGDVECGEKGCGEGVRCDGDDDEMDKWVSVDGEGEFDGEDEFEWLKWNGCEVWGKIGVDDWVVWYGKIVLWNIIFFEIKNFLVFKLKSL